MSKVESVTQVNEVNRISVGTEFRGKLISSCDIRIDGYFEGDLNTTGKLVIGESGKLIGNVISRSCDIWGTLQGKVVVRETFGLKKSGSITGNLFCQRIFIEDGGLFNGSCKMIDENTFGELSGGELPGKQEHLEEN
ncbi:MAG TPA: polymer-forming cytoskeletal protein [Bacteroidales bacterium]|jgi:cytoskeletal protein CcmA (bactofilin family)|nr:polymer-forming cytoskeletal protein [Bacteroidales bacterium]HON54683.1 polymer-forming cytoskeletal protein [Bacteroidales bacterium]HRR49076.1 polymer-forming cytoskeletal protein [Bacteroidales bacterium]HRT33184.1 polymer-forming cytoskeletal protein [Bacteroidales bacterium]HRT83706.1 polymer-forming cytoskeletal protein [Bacteroidales bacterium]